MQRTTTREALVPTDWLEAHLGDPDLRVFECTTYLKYAEPDAGVPYHPEAGRADYEAGHIPARVFWTCRASCRARTRPCISCCCRLQSSPRSWGATASATAPASSSTAVIA